MTELRKNYTDAERKAMAKTGEAMPDGSYPIKTAADLSNAIRAVGLGNASDTAIRKHIIARAKALGLTSELPEAWNSDGTKDASESDSTQTNSAVRASETRFAPVYADADYPDGMRCFDCNHAFTNGDAVFNRTEGALTTPLCQNCHNDAYTRRTRKPRQHSADVPTEVRFFTTPVELRSDEDSNEIILTGTPIVYNVGYPVQERGRRFTEEIRSGALSGLLSTNPDVRFLINHEGMPLARTSSGTLTLTDNPHGLTFEARLDARSTQARDLMVAIERGDINQMSVGFQCGADSWSSDRSKRSISGLKSLLDVSAVTYPASPTTHIAVAKRMMMQDDLDFDFALDAVMDELRAGRTHSQATIDKLVTAHSALQDLLSAAGVNFAMPDDTDGTEQSTEPSTDDGSDDPTVRLPADDDGVTDLSTDDGTNTNPQADNPNTVGLYDATGSRSLDLELELLELRGRGHKHRVA